MSIPNIGPEHADQGDPDGVESHRRGNPALVYRDESPTDEVSAATARASTVTHRFGGVRYALTRPNARVIESGPSAEDGDSDARA
ncbi:hypothetical protein GCM10010172_51510 [Paractinoplanes ferrugineus]|uniref:Uncharacterized protein n=1 Tax=Paractinoplanes ferrugineus TaxID=113564 RepID=A0A919MGW2_9ACTN|nr:hypothetical protein [Actinoplanes ferrugineus]GIE12030.1 hypothetical protein Afe05nite_38700 [Actinoplanes ferrugineus]